MMMMRIIKGLQVEMMRADLSRPLNSQPPLRTLQKRSASLFSATFTDIQSFPTIFLSRTCYLRRELGQGSCQVRVPVPPRVDHLYLEEEFNPNHKRLLELPPLSHPFIAVFFNRFSTPLNVSLLFEVEGVKMIFQKQSTPLIMKQRIVVSD
jgi:hypothetical protein